MESHDRKGFNKRAFFNQKLKKNFGSQQEGHGRAFLQKKAFVRQYYKEKKWQEKRENKGMMHQGEPVKETPLFPRESQETAKDEETAKDTVRDDEMPSQDQPKKKKKSSLNRARLQYHKKVAEREKKYEEFTQKKEDIAAAKVKRKEERLKRYKKLNQKTKKGQPVMRGRIELMLEKLEKEMG